MGFSVSEWGKQFSTYIYNIIIWIYYNEWMNCVVYSIEVRIYLIQIKHLLKMLVPSEVYHQKIKIEMTEYIRAKYPGDNS